MTLLRVIAGLPCLAFASACTPRALPPEVAPCACADASDTRACPDIPGAWAGIHVLTQPGGRVDWSPDGARIAFDRAAGDGFNDVFTIGVDGTDDRCLTCGVPGLERHNGNPAWHPSGKLLVFQAEKPKKGGSSFGATPGRGARNDLWLADLSSSTFFKLTDVPADSGVLHPHFSRDGTKLTWTELIKPAELTRPGHEAGGWRLMMAGFRMADDGPHLDDARAFEPLGPGFYENHGLDPQGRWWIFSSNARNPETAIWERSDLFAFDPASGELRPLTDDAYNEHASYSPDGEHLTFMSTRDNAHGTDFWLMRPDGTDRRRLTWFNAPGTPHAVGNRLTAADNSWSPDGRHVVAWVNAGTLTEEGAVVVLSPFCAAP